MKWRELKESSCLSHAIGNRLHEFVGLVRYARQHLRILACFGEPLWITVPSNQALRQKFAAKFYPSRKHMCDSSVKVRPESIRRVLHVVFGNLSYRPKDLSVTLDIFESGRRQLLGNLAKLLFTLKLMEPFGAVDDVEREIWLHMPQPIASDVQIRSSRPITRLKLDDDQSPPLI